MHSYHFYVDHGLPQKQVLRWVYGQELRAVFDNVLLAEYHCHFDRRERKVKDIRIGRFYPSPFASRQKQGALLEFNPLDSMVVYRPRSVMPQVSPPFPAEQLWLFEQVQSA